MFQVIATIMMKMEHRTITVTIMITIITSQTMKSMKRIMMIVAVMNISIIQTLVTLDTLRKVENLLMQILQNTIVTRIPMDPFCVKMAIKLPV